MMDPALQSADSDQAPGKAGPGWFWQASERRLPVNSLLGSIRRLEREVAKLLQGPRQPQAQRTPNRIAGWIRENGYILQASLRQVSKNLPRPFLKRLPLTPQLEGANEIRIFRLSNQLVEQCRGSLEVGWLRESLHQFQREAPLTIGEIWALPSLLRLSVLDRLTRLAKILLARRQEEQAAFEPLPDEQEVAGCLRSLRLLEGHDWRKFFEEVSTVERILRGEPSAIYARMDFDTRNSYRSLIERLARRSPLSEGEVARKAVALASSAGGEGSIHVGHFLLGRGIDELKRGIGYRGAWREGFAKLFARHALLLYLAAVAASAILLAGGAASLVLPSGAPLWKLALWAALAALPAWSAASEWVALLAVSWKPPRRLPRLDFDQGVAQQCSTMVVVPSMKGSLEEVDRLLNALEVHQAGNGDQNIWFALLTDFADAPQETMPDDQALLERAKAGIAELNRRADSAGQRPFFLFNRRRRWNQAEGCWMGWERKRGKLEQFNRLLAGEEVEDFTARVGNLAVLPRIRYVITLDADTFMPPRSAARLIATLAHPLNQARFMDDAAADRSGYSVLQPRVEPYPRSYDTLYARIMAGEGGFDLYSSTASDLYQDLFGEGSFAGKGIYDVSAFRNSLQGRVPENSILSHDLFEGAHGRSGLVSDVVLLEDIPSNAYAAMQRLHRWVRGDWQLLPWLRSSVPDCAGGRVKNKFSSLSRWRIFDNLRRSLLAPALLLFFLAGWAWLESSAWIWTLFGLAAVAAPVSAAGLFGMRRLMGAASLPVLKEAAFSLRAQLLRGWMALTCLPFQAMVVSDAAARALWRMGVSRRRLLQWSPWGRQSNMNRGKGSSFFWRSMAAVPICCTGFTIFLAALRPHSLPAALPLLLLWAASPQIVWWTGRPVHLPKPRPAAGQQRRLRAVARRTWLFFEVFTQPQDHWLIPDNYQEEPGGILARRTSPTDLAMQLLSTLAAYDLGYVSSAGLATRLSNTLASMKKLQRYRGHFLNWYDTATLRPLEPQYVSTVDSGNLAAALLAVKQACIDAKSTPILRPAILSGLLDTLDLLQDLIGELEPQAVKEAAQPFADRLQKVRRELESIPAEIGSIHKILDLADREGPRLVGLLTSLVESVLDGLSPRQIGDIRIFADFFHQTRQRARAQIDTFAPWLVAMRSPPRLFRELDPASPAGKLWKGLRQEFRNLPILALQAEVCQLCLDKLSQLDRWVSVRSPGQLEREAADWVRSLMEKIQGAQKSAHFLLTELDAAAALAEQFFAEMEFSFLFDESRHLFHIGYSLSNHALDSNHYDLLSSEARLASFVAIAKGDVEPLHWLHLGRLFFRSDSMRGLLSWSATLFEYLMPSLLMHTPPDTLLSDSCRAAIHLQRKFAARRSIPWGISESGYFHFDDRRNYQYRAFGVPGLGLAPGLGERLVVSPYSCLLALRFSPREVMENLQRLTGQGLLGRYGLYEAVDYGLSRSPALRRPHIVRSYMAHHQGMILTAIANHLEGDLIPQRFHADVRIASVQHLVYEVSPKSAPLLQFPHKERRQIVAAAPPVEVETWQADLERGLQAQLLSNGRLSLLAASDGSGGLWLDGIAATRWSDDRQGPCGSWVYIADLEQNKLFSAGMRPIPDPHTPSDQQDYQVFYSPHKAEYRRRCMGLLSVMEVAVCDPGIEIRRVKLYNETGLPRTLMLASYGEVVLAPPQQDRRHPAFSKLFVESLYDSDAGALLFRRRPRSPGDQPLWLGHALLCSQALRKSWETERGRFLGRGGSASRPLALRQGVSGLSRSCGATLDPIFSFGCEIELAPQAEAEVSFLTVAARSRSEITSLLKLCRSSGHVEEAFQRTVERTRLEVQQMGFSTQAGRNAQRLFSAILYPRNGLRRQSSNLSPPLGGQRRLWAFGISGDHPIVLAKIASQDDLSLIRPLIQAQAFWRSRLCKIDLVIFDERSGGYSQPLRDQVRSLVEELQSGVEALGGICFLSADQVTEQDRPVLEHAARCVLEGRGGPLAQQLEAIERHAAPLPEFVAFPPAVAEQPPVPALERPAGLLFDNGLGGFSSDGREYVLHLEAGQRPPAPWINVIANPVFGCIVSESGAGHSWAHNSAENRLTPWHNDPVCDPPGEVLYLRDEETGQFWSVAPSPAAAAGDCQVRHGAGYTLFRRNSHGLEQQCRIFVDRSEPVKLCRLRLTNRWQTKRHLTATYYAEWVLGTDRQATAPFLVLGHHSQALLAQNPYNAEDPERVAFLTSDRPLFEFTCDRQEFLGSGGLKRPAALTKIGLSGNAGPVEDPCAALQIHLYLEPGQSLETHFCLGQGRHRQQALELAGRFASAQAADRSWSEVSAFWDDLLGRLKVRTPNRSMDLMLNRWLLYQNLSCRMWGRSALYQSGGAFGFRDQLQDAMALTPAAPEMVRHQILLAAAHQFEEGDVLHWWHPPARGVRTRCSDDLLWLPFVAAHYLRATGDWPILDEEVPFLQADPLAHDEADRYSEYGAGQSGSLYEHCLRAIRRGLQTGPHGLPLIGSGDWNDGMDRVGIQGRGESVWLGWFGYATLSQFAPVCEQRGDGQEADSMRRRAEALQAALEESAWDGQWYRRAYFDDGTPLGSALNQDCRIDLIAQAWAVISGAGRPGRSLQALQSALDQLLHREARLFALLAPPFDRGSEKPGYIKGYPPGIRENGGQYTHAAIWAAWAWALLGRGDLAMELFDLLNPIHHTRSQQDLQRYRLEPFAAAADVYSQEPHRGRGGWSWYTGSAGWLYRLGIEAILGLRLREDSFEISPCIPSRWKEFEIEFRRKETVYKIRVINPDGVQSGVRRVTLDGQGLQGSLPCRRDGGLHHVLVEMGKPEGVSAKRLE